MSLDVLRLFDARSQQFAPIGSQHVPPFCLLLLTAACALASFAFACATPFAAFAAIAAAMLRLPAALLVVAAAWIVNQAIGFGALGYPIDLNTMLWGTAIGAAALTATVASVLVLRVVPRASRPVALGLALVAAYLAYEVVLFACTLALGGAGAFTPTIVAGLGLSNILWMIGLIAACEVVPLVAAMRRRRTFA
jgi:hypothetical protein